MKKILTVAFLALISFSAFALTSGPKKGQTAPELKGYRWDGEEFSLSSFKGNYVLVDFWASWCPPCRESNPKLVRLYHDLKDKKFKNGASFHVLSVSLDKNVDKWRNAVEADKLEWPAHISDLKGWESALGSAYDVRAIPTAFLVSPEGKVILKGNLHDIYSKLKSQLSH